MATYTILRNSKKNNSSDIVIEFTVPGGNNSANIPWRTIVSQVRADAGQTGSQNTLKAGNAAHVTKLDAGQIVEIQLTVKYDANALVADKVAALDAAATAKIAEFTSEFGSLYQFYGTERTI